MTDIKKKANTTWRLASYEPSEPKRRVREPVSPPGVRRFSQDSAPLEKRDMPALRRL